MSTIEITSKIEALKELEALIEEAKAEAETLRDEIKTEMLNRNTEEMEAGQYIVRWTSVLSQRFDSTAFKKVMPDIYKSFTKQVSSRRFSIAQEKALVRAATLARAAQEKPSKVIQGYAYYKPLPLQNQGGKHHEAAHQLQPCRRVSQQGFRPFERRVL